MKPRRGPAGAGEGGSHSAQTETPPLRHPYPLRGCNSDSAQYSNTPSLRVAGSEERTRTKRLVRASTANRKPQTANS